jgi:Allophanate hydrolase subunit 1
MKQLEVNYVQGNGDCALLIFFKSHAQRPLRLQALAQYIRHQQVEGIIEVVPAVDSLMLVFDRPTEVDDDIMAAMADACQQSLAVDLTPQTHDIPVCYDSNVAPDIEAVMSYTGLSLEEVIAAHSEPIYEISFLGFLPGFAYLSGLPQSLRIPRKSAPTTQTPAGSIAIANQQCGIYALNSPGGWHVIGRTPVSLINWQSQQKLPYQPLDKIKFKPIELAQFEQQCNDD